MTAHFDENTLSAYIDGELGPEELPAVEAFIEADDDARRYVLETVGVHARLRAEMNAVAHEEVPERLYAALQNSRRNKAPDWPLRKLLQVAAALVLLVAGYGVAQLLQKTGGGGEKRSRQRTPAENRQTRGRARHRDFFMDTMA